MNRRQLLSSALSAFALQKIAEAQSQGAIAALKSRRAEAKPITVAERKDRLERARQLMQENHIDAICTMGGTSLQYFTGIRWWNSERLFTFVLPQKGTPFYVSPAF